MDDIFEVLIYVLLIGASVVGGIYKNYAKKKEEEERRQKQLQNSTRSNSEEQTFEPRQNSPMPTALEDFLKQQFETESEPLPIEDEIESELINENTEHLDTVHKEEGIAAFKKTRETLLSDNLHDSGFSISKEIEKQKNSANISEEEKNAYSISEVGIKDENSFDLQQAVIYSEILKRPYA